ncbi:MAG: porin [Pseudomonadales bacterium]|nr:porin [Pseudomonadales bacterium]
MTKSTIVKQIFTQLGSAAVIASTAVTYSYAESTQISDEVENRLSVIESRLDQDDSRVTINGFFSASFITHGDDTAVTDNWGGATDKNDFSALSNVGIQMMFDINDEMTMVTQLVARGEEAWNLEAEWAFIAYEATDALTLRFGRQKGPLYLLSEYIEVGYAMPWITAPDEVYGITGDSTYDGIGALYTFAIGDWDTTIQALYANNSFYSDNIGDVDLNDFITLSITGESENWTLRLSYSVVSGDIPALGGGIVPANDNTDISYASAGAKFDNGDWLLMSEVVSLAIDGPMADTDSAYFLVGYRFGNVMPHFTWSHMKNGDPGDRDSLGPIFGPAMDAALVENQTTYTAGVRWDFMAGVAAKFEVSHVTDFDDTKGQFKAGTLSDDSVNIVKFSLDSVF